MKLNKTWQKQWEAIDIPEEKMSAQLKTALQETTVPKKRGQKIRMQLKRPLYRLLLAAATLAVVVFGISQLLPQRESADYASHQMARSEAGNEAQTVDEAAEPATEAPSPGINADKKAYFYTIYKETTTFDNDLQKIQQLTEQLGGYLENSSIDTATYEAVATRYATFVLRIPTEKNAAFVKELEPLGTTLSENVASENYSLTYADNESRIAALKTEEAALLKMLEKSTKVEEAILIQEQLTRIRTERESLTRDNRAIDNQVNFSTFTLSITEVATEKNASILTRIKDNWRKQGTAWKNFFINLGIFLGSNILYLVLAAAIIAGFLFYRKNKPAK